MHEITSYMSRMGPTTAHQDCCTKWHFIWPECSPPILLHEMHLIWAEYGSPRLLWNNILHGPNVAHYGPPRLLWNGILHGLKPAHQDFCGKASYLGRIGPSTAHQNFCTKWHLTWVKRGPLRLTKTSARNDFLHGPKPGILWNGILHGPNEAHYGRLRLMRNDIFHGPSSADYPRVSNIYFGTWGPIWCMVGPSPQDPLQA
jgi:hypothetical protein